MDVVYVSTLSYIFLHSSPWPPLGPCKCAQDNPASRDHRSQTADHTLNILEVKEATQHTVASNCLQGTYPILCALCYIRGGTLTGHTACQFAPCSACLSAFKGKHHFLLNHLTMELIIPVGFLKRKYMYITVYTWKKCGKMCFVSSLHAETRLEWYTLPHIVDYS